MIIIPIKWLFHWEYTLFSDKPTSMFLFENPWRIHDVAPMLASPLLLKKLSLPPFIGHTHTVLDRLKTVVHVFNKTMDLPSGNLT